jgi:hypothetical protein
MKPLAAVRAALARLYVPLPRARRVKVLEERLAKLLAERLEKEGGERPLDPVRHSWR